MNKYVYLAYYYNGEPTGVKRIELKRAMALTLAVMDGWKQVSYRKYLQLRTLVSED